jgi:hydroxymethylbilane synthase
MRPDLEIRTIRGNVDTRLAKVAGGDYDATVLALAGLRRMGLEERASQVFTLEEMLPAPAQGALAAECRESDAATRRALDAIHQPALAAPVTAERAFMSALEAGCSFPTGAHAALEGDQLLLTAVVAGTNGLFRDELRGPASLAEPLGAQLATRLLRASGRRP